MPMLRSLYTLIYIAIAITAVCAPRTDTGTAILNERLRSLQVRNAALPYSMPGEALMVLNSDDMIRVVFDVLNEDRDYLRYELIHCNADWQPSQLAYIEYLDGFNEGTIDDYQFSQGTNVHYVHYTLTLPNQDVSITRSGNYLLKIYPEGNPDEIWAQCRFVVSDQSAAVAASVTSRTDVDVNREHQQLALEVDVSQADVDDLFNEVKLVITQNGRTDNSVTLAKPLRVSGKRLIYEHLQPLIFKAGNEYRRFENISNTYPGAGVESVVWKGPYYHAVLEADESRAGESYHYDETLSGSYVVREYNSDNSDTEADYVVTHFTLNYPETPGMDFFIDGDFVQRRFSPEARMVFNRATGRYEHAMLLKQGAYSYQYLALTPGAERGRTDVIEGDKYETRNRYRVYVYARRHNERADRLVAVRDVATW